MPKKTPAKTRDRRESRIRKTLLDRYATLPTWEATVSVNVSVNELLTLGHVMTVLVHHQEQVGDLSPNGGHVVRVEILLND